MLGLSGISLTAPVTKQFLSNKKEQQIKKDLKNDSFERTAASFGASPTSAVVVAAEKVAHGNKRTIIAPSSQLIDPSLTDLCSVTARKLVEATERSMHIVVDGHGRRANPNTLAPETVEAVRKLHRQAIVL